MSIASGELQSLIVRAHLLLEADMKETRVSLPELILVAGTRVALGAGLGLLLSKRLSEDQRKGAGWALFGIGALTTIPLAFEILGGQRMTGSVEREPPTGMENLNQRRVLARN
jgi:hypothetical protein